MTEPARATGDATPQAPGDWTGGDPRLLYQRCVGCGHVWYFRRGFCPRCGRHRPEIAAASGRGKVAAVTRIMRAPTEALQALAPYTLVLVDTDEGFRLMAHGAGNLAVGTAVQARYVAWHDRLVPFFDAVDGAA
jgi:uncharacterized OB-fold protein